MKIAVEGCAHGELDNIYNTIKHLEEKEGFTIDLLICCGDFQASRNEEDLLCMAVPLKYCKICSFYKYYTGEKVAPVLTIFIGGNHEASNHLQELPYGGWVAPNIYYLGYAGVINIAGVRIGGISGIYKGRDYMKGHFEYPPYDDSTKRSVYHIRNLEVFRLKQISGSLNVFLSHDWPCGVWEYGNKRQLIKFKPFFKKDIQTGELGSKPTEELLNTLKPEYWFAAHLHCKFAALIPHDCGKTTKFLALDKCLPNRRFLQIMDISHDSNLKFQISYDLEWLTILRLTNHLLSVKNVTSYMPGPTGNERWCFTPTEEEKLSTFEMMAENLVVPNNFEKTVEGYNGQNKLKMIRLIQPVSNPQTALLCKQLSIDDPLNFLTNLNESLSSMCASNVETSKGSQTFIDDSVNNLSQRKLVLNLPKPVNENLEKNVEEKEEIKTQVKATEGIPNEKNPVEQTESQPSTNKQFVRRNASIYQNQDDET